MSSTERLASFKVHKFSSGDSKAQDWGMKGWELGFYPEYTRTNLIRTCGNTYDAPCQTKTHSFRGLLGKKLQTFPGNIWRQEKVFKTNIQWDKQTAEHQLLFCFQSNNNYRNFNKNSYSHVMLRSNAFAYVSMLGTCLRQTLNLEFYPERTMCKWLRVREKI